jgi:hypothetical protein
MSELSFETVVQLESRRCWKCGRHWAYEKFVNEHPGCPVCAGNENSRLYDRVQKLERSLASVRGALTKARNRKSRAR